MIVEVADFGTEVVVRGRIKAILQEGRDAPAAIVFKLSHNSSLVRIVVGAEMIGDRAFQHFALHAIDDRLNEIAHAKERKLIGSNSGRSGAFFLSMVNG